MDFKALLTMPEYNFIHTHPRLGNRIMLLGVSGSYGYGTNREGSDIDLRGVTLHLPSDLIGLTSFEQYEDDRTDTVIFSFGKAVNLFLSCNPNTIEILGLDEDQYVIMSDAGRELLNNRDLFLTKRAVSSFGHYAQTQLKKLQNVLERGQKDDDHRNKHAMHLIRLYMMGADILEKGQIRTHRPPEDLKLLRSIRSGEYMNDHVLVPEFYEIAAEYGRRFGEAEKHSTLPDSPDMEKVETFVESINYRTVTGELG